MISVSAYCRVSTSSSDQVNSFENQNLYFNRELLKNPNYSLYRVYADRGITGTKLHREEFDQMLRDAGLDILEVKNDSGYLKYVTLPSNRTPKFKYIFVKNTSRFARNVEVASIFRDLSRMGVYVVFLDLGKSTENEADATYIQIFCSFDERESRDKRTKVLFGIEEGNRKGVIRTNGKIFGYRYIQKENRLEIIEEEAVVVRRVFNLYSSGYGIRQIINILEEEGYKTRQGKRFVKNAISRMLDNEKYFGVSNNCKTYLGNDLFDKFTTPKRKEEGEYELVENWKVPAIIEKDLFYKCKSIREGKVNYNNQKGVKKSKSKYSGMIYCDTCGSVYTSNVDEGRHFYNCKTKKLRGTKHCDNPNISEKQIKLLLSDFLKNSKKSDSVIQEELSYWYALGRLIIDSKPSNSEVVTNLKDKEKTLLERLNGLYDLYAMKQDKNSNLSLLSDRIETTEQEIEAIREEIVSLSINDKSISEKLKFIENRIDEIENINFNINTIEDLIPRVIIYANRQGEAYVTFKAFDSKDRFKDLSLEDATTLVGYLTEPEVNKNTFNNYVMSHCQE